MKKVSEMSLQEKKNLRMIITITLGVMIFVFGFSRIHQKVTSIVQSNDFQEFKKVDVPVPEFSLPAMDDFFEEEILEELNQELSEQEIEEIIQEYYEE